MNKLTPSSIAFVSNLYDLVLLLVTVYSAWRFRKLNLPSKLICVLIWNGFLTEWGATYAAHTHRNNIPVYGISTLLEFFIICLFFNYALTSFKKHHLGIYIGTGGLILGLANMFFLQPLDSINSNFLYLEFLIVTCLSLYLTFRMLIAMDIVPGKEVHFWFSSIVLFFQCTTLWIWAIYEYVDAKPSNADRMLLNYSLLLVGLITYPAYALILYRYPKLKRSYV